MADVGGVPFWSQPPGGGSAGSGDFVGPGSSTDNAIVRYDGTTGKLGQNSIVVIPDADALATPALALGTDPDTGVSWVGGANTVSLVAGAKEALRALTAANAVNYATVTPSATGTGLAATRVEIAAAGSDANVSLSLLPKGTSNATQSRILFGALGGITLWDDADWQLGNNAGSGFTRLRFNNAFALSAQTADTFVVQAKDGSSSWLGVQPAFLRTQSGSVHGWSSDSSPNSTAADSGLSRIAAGVVGVGTGAAGSAAGKLLTARLVEANTAGSGAPNLLTVNENRTLLTNEGATAENYHTLPTALSGDELTFYCQDTDGIRVVANTGDTIRLAGTASAAAGFVRSSTAGSCITLVAINATEWVATSIVGTWTVDV